MANASNTNAVYCSRLISAATTNATLVNAYPCYFIGGSFFNIGASAAYIKIYDKASTPTVGTDIPVAVFIVPPGNATPAEGINNTRINDGLYLVNGLAFAVVGGITDNSTTTVAANEIMVNIFYKKG